MNDMVYSVSSGLYKEMAALSKEKDIPITMHCAEVKVRLSDTPFDMPYASPHTNIHRSNRQIETSSPPSPTHPPPTAPLSTSSAQKPF